MMTLTGNYVTPDIGAMTLVDIALGLSRMPRYGGQTLIDWFVADHVVCAHEYIRRMIDLGLNTEGLTSLFPLHVLLHDAHEAMTSDIPTHFKTKDMKQLQRELDKRIYTYLGYPLPNTAEHQCIRAIDRQMLLAEAKIVCPPATYEKICWETEDIAMPGAVSAVEEHIHNDVDAREAFLAIAATYDEEGAFNGR